jgi:hypothetical protein
VPEWNEVGQRAAQQAGFAPVGSAVYDQQRYHIYEQPA